MAKFSGDRVIVSEKFFWAKGATGTIAEFPFEVKSINGEWGNYLTRIERSSLGQAIVYWVEFDEPQLDADGDGPYRAGSIHKNALSLISAVSH